MVSGIHFSHRFARCKDLPGPFAGKCPLKTADRIDLFIGRIPGNAIHHQVHDSRNHEISGSKRYEDVFHTRKDAIPMIMRAQIVLYSENYETPRRMIYQDA